MQQICRGRFLFIKELFKSVQFTLLRSTWYKPTASAVTRIVSWVWFSSFWLSVLSPQIVRCMTNHLALGVTNEKWRTPDVISGGVTLLESSQFCYVCRLSILILERFQFSFKWEVFCSNLRINFLLFSTSSSRNISLNRTSLWTLDHLNSSFVINARKHMTSPK